MIAFAEPHLLVVDPRSGAIQGATRRYQKRFCDLQNLYQDEAAFAELLSARAQEVAYEVHEHRPSDQPGDLITGTSVMYPGRVGAEFFITRGHIHARSDRPEIYYCQSGRGVMLMETPDGQTRATPLTPQSIVYVPPFWIHRSINTGHDRLVTVFCYPADAGQDYGIISDAGGMKTLIVAYDQNTWKEIPNPRYRARSPAEIARWVPGK